MFVILSGLGATAFLMTKAEKDADKKRTDHAAEKGRGYNSFNSTLVLTVPEAERNISYRLEGVITDGTAWHMISHCWHSIITSARSKFIFNPSAE